MCTLLLFALASLTSRPNVLFLMVDDMKTDIGCYGDPYAITPSIDALAADGTVYRRAYCQQALSGPTRASLLTGLRPEQTGVTELETWIRKKNRNIVTMPQAFKEAGYETRSIGKTFHGAKNTLDSLSWSKTPRLYSYTKNDEYQILDNKTGGKSVSYEFAQAPEDDYLDIRIRKEAINEIDELADGKSPFFLAVGFLKPHLPFCAPRRFLDLYDNVAFGQTDTSRIVDAPTLAYHNSEELRGYTDIPSFGSISEEQNLALKKAYYACTSFADENIGAVINELKRLGLFENTVIVILGDHGYHTGEQGLWCKSTNYEAACRAPLIIKGPGKARGKIVNYPVEFVDIFPTLCRMCDVPAPQGIAGQDLATIHSWDHHYAVSQFPRPYNALNKASLRTDMGYVIRNEKWTYMEWFDMNGSLVATELYNMAHNDLETRNLAYLTRYRHIRHRLSAVMHKVISH